ncbi:hypothetical protein NPX13_g1013 [Xylaria arbuscula]|uniref:Uncharacterized protein n=1 Tax=Xylaria arbuscula TaxID=114810 RepID=A0A9W8TS46_9PEZI|nr:hypothetical protein NPX13_g1013 [Xylaria arbuscula]
MSSTTRPGTPSGSGHIPVSIASSSIVITRIYVSSTLTLFPTPMTGGDAVAARRQSLAVTKITRAGPVSTRNAINVWPQNGLSWIQKGVMTRGIAAVATL